MVAPAILRRAAGNTFAAFQKLVFPLTYDEKDSTNAVSLTRSGGLGPLVTPSGFEGDGWGARLTYGSVPAFVNAGAFTLHGTLTPPMTYLGAAREDMLTLVTNDANAYPRMGFSVITDPRASTQGAIAARCYSGGAVQSQTLGRPAWQYEMRSPDILLGGLQPKPQAIIFMDSTYVTMSVHVEDTQSIFYKIRLSDKAVVAQFTFGTSTYKHVATIAKRSNGDVWIADYDTGYMLRIDLDASFAAGTAVILQTLDTTAFGIGSSAGAGVGSIDFATLGGTEYLLLAQYDTTESLHYLYLINVSFLSGSSIAITDRYKRFGIGRRVQGIVVRGANLLVARNNLYGALSPAGTVGYIQEFNITGMASTLADGQNVNASTNPTYLLNQWFAPCAYPEDLALHPVSGRLFTVSEGGYAVGDQPGYLGMWSWDLTPAAAVNHYTASYDGGSSVTLKVNNYVFATMAWTPSQTAAILCIGGPPTGTAAFGAGWSWAGVANVLIQNQTLSDPDYAAVISGSYETSVLTTYTLTLTNPGAELGVTTGWTNETGGIAVKNTADRKPPEGTWYFDGGSNVISVARQRLDLVAQGVSATDLDTGLLWAKIRWQQAAFDATDPGGMGLRMLNAAAGTISTNYSGLAWTLGGAGTGGPFPWFPRSYPVTIPTLTRSVDALFNASGRTSGTNNDLYVDIVTVKVYKP